MENLFSATAKHIDDVELLLGDGRFDNAAYLSGYVVECALKSLLLGTAMPGAKELGHDLGMMTGNAFHFAISLSPARRRYAAPSSSDFLALVASWLPEERYAARGKTSRSMAESRLKAAYEAYQALVVSQILDGRITYIP